MNQSSRSMNVVKNFTNGILSKVITLVMSFAVRTVFIQNLSTEYLGVNGLFGNILTVLSLAELGFGTAMVYSMYKPLAEKNNDEIAALMRLYKKVYRIIGIVVCAVGLIITPFLEHLIDNDTSLEISELSVIFLMYLANTVASYWFFAYKSAILSADQKNYVNMMYSYIFTIIRSVVQIIVLVVFQQFILYLLIQIICTILQNIFVSQRVNKEYPYLKHECELKLPKEKVNKIVEDVKALFYSRVGHIMLNGTDNIIIAKFVGLIGAGFLSNYVMIVESVTGVISQVCGAMTASVGNYVALNSDEDNYKLFKKIDFLNFWLYGFCMVALILLMNPFIKLWLGEKYLLTMPIVVAISVNFYIQGIVNTLWLFRSTLGLFVQGKYRPVILGALNIALSVLFAIKWGMFGVLIATTVSRICVTLWYDPLIIFRHGLKRKVREYYGIMIRRGVLLAVLTMIMIFIRKVILEINMNAYVVFLLLLLITAIVPNIILYVIYRKRTEFIEVLQTIKHLRKR